MIKLTLTQNSHPRRFEAAIKEFAPGLTHYPEAFAKIPVASKRLNLPKGAFWNLVLHLISDATMKKMNHNFRGKDSTTDVLTFSFVEGGAPFFAHENHGEIYISLPEAARQAKKEKHSLCAELHVLSVHGVLHFMGYDHEKSKSAARKMQEKEKTLLAKLLTTNNNPPKELTGR